MVLNARLNATKRKARCIMIHIGLWVWGGLKGIKAVVYWVQKSGKNVRFYLLKAAFEPVKNCELTPK